MSNSNPGFLAAAKAAQTLYAHVLTKKLFFCVALLTWLQIFYDMDGWSVRLLENLNMATLSKKKLRSKFIARTSII